MVAPGQDFTACRHEQEGARAIVRLRWGLVPSWARDARAGSYLINARAESVHYKPSFRAAFRLRRCLLPVDSCLSEPNALALRLRCAARWARQRPAPESLSPLVMGPRRLCA